jgi:hypothetical protein
MQFFPATKHLGAIYFTVSRAIHVAGAISESRQADHCVLIKFSGYCNRNLRWQIELVKHAFSMSGTS